VSPRPAGPGPAAGCRSAPHRGEDNGGDAVGSGFLGRFTGSVKLKAVMLVGEDDGTHPAEMRL